jgi:hypothetical protein
LLLFLIEGFTVNYQKSSLLAISIIDFFYNTSKIERSSSTDTCPGAEAFFAAPNVADEPNEQQPM